MYTIYKTTNLLNSKFYIGVHKTSNSNDYYLGSGKHLLSAIKKYGKENFNKEILATTEVAKDAFNLEKELVSRVLGLPLCYNVKAGGEGGFDYINTNGLTVGPAKLGARALAEKVKISPELQRMYSLNMIRAGTFRDKQKFRLRFSLLSKSRKGVPRTPEERKNISEGHRGEKNWYYGRKWLYNLDLKLSKPITLEEVDSYIANGWVIGRKMQF